MTLKHLQQPAGSKLCGQTCVAMLAGVSIDIATFHCSSGKNRATSEHDLRKGLAMLGYGLDPFERRQRGEHPGGRLPTDVIGVAPLLARLRDVRRKHGYHWIVITRTTVFDPALAEPWTAGTYSQLNANSWVSSFARVLPLSAFIGTTSLPYIQMPHELGTHREVARPFLTNLDHPRPRKAAREPGR